MKKMISTIMVSCAIAVLSFTTAFASTKTITGVTVRIGTDVEAGDYLTESIAIYDDSTEAQDGTYVGTNSPRYSASDAEWVTTDRYPVKIGDTPKMRIYIDTTDSDYAFKGSYSSSNVTIKGGTFVSAKKDSSGQLEIVAKVSAIKGTYDSPTEAYWKDSPLGRAHWTYDDDDDDANTSGYFDVYLYRGGSAIKKVECYKGTSYNFYPYMTKAGTYTFRVRCVPNSENEQKYGKKSEWLHSDEIYIDADHVSDGSGQTDDNGSSTPSSNTTQVGWINSNDHWYYRYPDGTYQKDSWLYLNNHWYLFDANGCMLTGWQTKNGNTYYLQADGTMYSGWVKASDKWYYLNTASDGVEGALHVGWLVKDGKTYYMDSTGAMCEGWRQVDGNWYYFYPNSGNKAVNTTIDTFYVDANGVWRK